MLIWFPLPQAEEPYGSGFLRYLVYQTKCHPRHTSFGVALGEFFSDFMSGVKGFRRGWESTTPIVSF